MSIKAQLKNVIMTTQNTPITVTLSKEDIESITLILGMRMIQESKLEMAKPLDSQNFAYYDHIYRLCTELNPDMKLCVA